LGVTLNPKEIPLSLYVHWPWCVRKCPYCDFNSHASGTVPETRYVEALLQELEREAHLAGGREIRTIYFGGGTPSLMSAEGFTALLDGIRRRVCVASDAEISMEANPGTADEAKFEAYAEAGVNRLSLGIQSFDDASLKRLGRIHDRAAAVRALEKAVRIFPRVNADLMFGLPFETIERLRDEVAALVDSKTTHVSCYQLTIESGTAFAKRVPEGLPDEDLAADLEEAVVSLLARAGFVRYEVSGYAKSGETCRHNLNYWTFGDYLAIGAGAHAKVTTEKGIFRAARFANPERYMRAVEEGVAPYEENRRVTAEELPFEFMLNALRLTAGVPKRLWTERTGLSDDVIAERVAQLCDEGLWTAEADRIGTSPRGFAFLSSVQEAFL
jgi:putative oxygen-independent coproporphyrinogen III oxidase